MEPTIKIFKTSEIFDCMEVFPSVIVTIVKHWDGQKQVKRAYMNYITIGLNCDQETAYNNLVNNYPALFAAASNYATRNSDVIYHY